MDADDMVDLNFYQQYTAQEAELLSAPPGADEPAPPIEVYIGPYVYEVLFAKSLPLATGHQDMDNLVIGVSQATEPEVQKSTLLHESLHAMLSQGLRGLLEDIDKKLEETLVAFLEPRLYAFILDNPGVMAWLQA